MLMVLKLKEEKDFLLLIMKILAIILLEEPQKIIMFRSKEANFLQIPEFLQKDFLKVSVLSVSKIEKMARK